MYKLLIKITREGIMTKKDYLIVAGAFNDSFSEWGGSQQVSELLEVFADWFENDNPNFDRDKFMEASTTGTEAEEEYDI
jgi:hypothetical protein